MQKPAIPKEKKGNKYSAQLFKELFIKELKYMYSAEKQALKFLQRAQKAASTRYLKACFKGHSEASLEQVRRIEKAFDLLNEKRTARSCSELNDLVKEAIQTIKLTKKNTLSRDLGLIALAQKIEQFEIKKYNSLINLANELGEIELNNLLEETLLEEQEAGEAFNAVMQDTQIDEMFKTDLIVDEGPEEESEILEAV